MKQRVKCMDEDCGKMFFSPVRQMWVAIARNKTETYKVRMLGANKDKSVLDAIKVDDNETLDVKKVLSPIEQFCLHCRLKHQREAQAMLNRDKNIAKMRAKQLGLPEDEVPIRIIPEDEAKAFDRYTVRRKIAMDYRQTQEDVHRAEAKPNPEAVQAALKKLEEIKKDAKDGETKETKV